MTTKIDELNLVWIDLEMTGLDTLNDTIIEVATVVTNGDLEVLAVGPELVIFQEDEIIKAMDEWNTLHHKESGLTRLIRKSELTLAQAEQQTLAFLEEWVPPQKSPICGNSICQDRRFLAREMPKLEEFFHYRNLDISSIKELVQRWRPDLVKGFTKKSSHRALDDVYDTIAEIKYYREYFIIGD
jgi:oligoribonuclease